MVGTWLGRSWDVVGTWLGRGWDVVGTWLGRGCHVVVTSSLSITQNTDYRVLERVLQGCKLEHSSLRNFSKPVAVCSTNGYLITFMLCPY